MTQDRVACSGAPELPKVADLHDAALARRLQRLLDGKTKPLGALGQIEALALRLGCILGSDAPVLREPQMLVCAADHGVAAQGVSAYPSDVTWQMVRNFLAGGAAVSVLARQHGLALTVVDCGVRQACVADGAPPAPEGGSDPQGDAPAAAQRRVPSADGLRPRLLLRRIAPGTADASTGAAMTTAQCLQALDNGREIVRALPGNALLLGEMGIGNTSAASMLLARLAGLELDACVGTGTGLDAAGLRRKRDVLARAMALHQGATGALDALAAFGGFEIATLTGAVLQAACERRVVVVDGFIAGAAVLVAQALRPHVVQRCIAAHRSAEPGHALLLAHLGLAPLLQLDLRLGEGSGAALAWPLLESACRLLREMASFESAGVSKG